MKNVLSPRWPAAELNDEAIEHYLCHHPEFFADHLGLLEILTVPHPSGAAVSLVERQLALLRDKNQRLMGQLDNLLQIARENDALHQRMHQMTLTLLDATSVEDVLACLDWGLHQYFQTDFVAMRLLSPFRESPVANLFIQVATDAGGWCDSLVERDKPLCGPLAIEEAEFLFGDQAAEVASHAVIGLRHAGLRGILAIGSRDQGRFRPDMSFVFLNQMSEILAARLSSLLNAPG